MKKCKGEPKKKKKKIAVVVKKDKWIKKVINCMILYKIESLKRMYAIDPNNLLRIYSQ